MTPGKEIDAALRAAGKREGLHALNDRAFFASEESLALAERIIKQPAGGPVGIWCRLRLFEELPELYGRRLYERTFEAACQDAVGLAGLATGEA